jgi:hypothetical protein
VNYSPAVNPMAASDRYTVGFPSKHPAQGRAAIVADGAMTAELQKLRHRAIVLTAIDSIPQVQVADVTYELHR